MENELVDDTDSGVINAENLSFEEAKEQLIAIVAKLESGQTSIEELMQLWERGEAIADRCEQWLSSARQQLEQAKNNRESLN